MFDSIRPFLWPLAFLLLATLLWVTRPQDTMADFAIYHTAATRVLGGESPYAAADPRPFTFLPVVALVMTPFGLLRQDAAMFLWFAALVGLLTAFVRWAIQGLPERRRSDEALQWIVLAAMLPFFAHELNAGQLNIVLALLMVGALLAAQVELPRMSGVLAGLAVFLDPYALLLLPWLVLAHGTRAAVATLMVLALGLLAPALVYGWTGNVELLVSWFRLISLQPAVAEGASFGAMWTMWFGSGRLAPFLTVVTTGAVVGLLAVTFVRRRTVLDADYLEVALVMLAIPLVSSGASMWTFLLATPIVTGVLDRWAETPVGWRAAAGVAIVAAALAATVDLLGRGVLPTSVTAPVVTLSGAVLFVAATAMRHRAIA